MGGQFGGATTASLTPFLAKHFGWEMSFGAAASFCLLSAVAWLMVDPNSQLNANLPVAAESKNFGSEEGSYEENS